MLLTSVVVVFFVFFPSCIYIKHIVLCCHVKEKRKCIVRVTSTFVLILGSLPLSYEGYKKQTKRRRGAGDVGGGVGGDTCFFVSFLELRGIRDNVTFICGNVMLSFFVFFSAA